MRLPGPWEKIVKDFILGSRHGFDSMCCPTYYRSGCHEMLQATEEGLGRVCRGMACDNLPCGRRSLHIWDNGNMWRPFCYTSAALVALATPKVDGLAAWFIRVNTYVYRISSFLHAKVQPTYICIVSIHLFHLSHFKPFWRNDSVETK